MKVLVYPKDGNPYQELLYQPMLQRGVRIRYIGELTRSHTTNLALLPLEMLALRLAGWRVVHVHWVFGFSLPGHDRWPGLRQVSRVWFSCFLAVAGAIGLQVAWTAHNVLPHRPVFRDDLAARQALARSSSVVFAHSPSVFNELDRCGILTGGSRVVIPHGPFVTAGNRRVIPAAGSHAKPWRLLFVGRITEYKGVEDLLAAVALLPPAVPLRLTIAGACDDPQLLGRLRCRPADLAGRVHLAIGHLSDDELRDMLSEADVVVLPFRRITTSGSAVLALSYGRPVVVPEHPTLDDLPAGATIRYDGSIESLATTLAAVNDLSASDLAGMSNAARQYCEHNSWQRAADLTIAAFSSLVGEYPPTRSPSAPARAQSRATAMPEEGS